MSAVLDTSERPAAPADKPWSLWRRQVAAILRLEMRKSFFSRRALLLYLMALLPVAALAGFALVPMAWRESDQIAWAGQVFAGVYQFILRALIFFGCAWVFTSLFRGEVLDRSLHYYLLAPVRREVLVAGKYLSALIATVVLFGGSTLLSYLLLLPPYGWRATERYLFDTGGLSHLAAYLGITALGCLGYGAVFLLIGLLFRNPILPAGLILVWESANFLLLPGLKKLSVIHYLKNLLPDPLPEGPFAVVGKPSPAWVSVVGLLAFAALMLVLSGLRIRRMEVDYRDD